ncbi:protein stoned-B-like [Mercenaria mercenaria]|uniref:protein stoned-B-like n=1 Tax=Mercenaria mercenaria TaxID=6596 RepID=UPI00234F3CD3|nr:protein stoned-B-like [Mercenaria mercenaria]
MSTGASFDDSSNLVDIAAPTNGEQKEGTGDTSDNQPDLLSFDEPEDIKEESKSQESKSKSKKSKAKRLFKRAKSPISGAINKTTKEFKKLSSLPKHHHSSSPKSPQRSPSREKLTEEYSHLEQKLNEKTSEEWLVFQQMQDRVKETVVKSQQKLKHYTSQSEDEEPKQTISTKWTGFEADSGLEPEVIDTSLHPSISITCPANDSDTVDLLDSGTDIPNVDIDLGLSPPVTPGPPVNSRITSMDNIKEEAEKAKEEVQVKGDELDFLGLIGSGQTAQQENKPSDMLSQDLLGLETFVSPDSSSGTRQDGLTIATSDVLAGYAFTSSMSADSSTAVNTETKTVNSDILMFEQPLETFNKTVEQTKASDSQVKQDELFTIDDINEPTVIAPVQDTMGKSEEQSKSALDIFGEPLKPSVVETTRDQSSTDVLDGGTDNKAEILVSATSVSDEFASFDPMKSDSFSVGFTPAVNIQRAHSPMAVNDLQQFESSPSQGMTYGSVPSSNIQVDIFSKIKQMSSSSQPVSPARRTTPKPKDVFGFVKKELKKPDEDEDDGDYKPLVALSTKAKTSEEMQEEKVEETLPGQPDSVNNPFLSSSFTEEMQTGEGFSSANAAQLFGVEPETLEIESGFDDLGKQAVDKAHDTVKSSWVTPGAFDDTDFGVDFETDEKWEDSVPTEKTQTGDVWGANDGPHADKTETKASDSDNPFLDDFSTFDEILEEQRTVDTSVNPFLSSDLTDAPLVATSVPAVSSSAPSNPFFNSTEASSDLLGGGNSAMLSDSESFFLDSVSDNKQDTEVADDIFDPFKVTAKSSEAITEAETGADSLDIFSSVAASGDKQLAKPSEDEDHGFMLDIKPVAERPKEDSLPVAPAIAPPPKAPKSPQPPRENPFDRDSPPEENFAQFEVMDASNNEMPKEAPPKSFSTDSTTTEEEPEVTLEPLEPFLPDCEKESFKLMLRYPTKKKIAGNRYWKNVVVKLETQKEGLMVRVLNDARDQLPIQELPLQPCYSLSDLSLQQYDQYGKIHTVKLQYVFYKERVGIKTERITPSIVKFKKRSEKPKATMILDHSPQVSELLKFGSLDKSEIKLFVQKVEDEFMKMEAKREKTLTYTKDEVTAEVRDEYYAELDCNGRVISQKARCRVFALAFLTGMPIVEMGLNDKRRKGKEVVGRCDIIPIKTEEWIRLENVEFHSCVNKEEFEKTNNIKFQPLDACQFELMRYRVRLRENKELPLQLTIQQILKQRKCEIRCDLLVTGYHSYSKKHGQFPCEDIEVLFPIPEVWIYMFRYERRFGYGSVHSAARKPGRIKGLERLTMMAQGNLNQALMEADVGTAKYEHIYRSIVWRIPRLPIRNQGAYTSHLFRLKLELGPHDEIPESFETHTQVSFTMPCSTTSQSQIRSIAVTNPNPPEKWVRSSAHYEYRIEIEHLDEYPELLAIGTVYKEAARLSVSENAETEEVEEERDPRLAQSDSDSSDSD